MIFKQNLTTFPKNLFTCKSVYTILFPKYQEKKLREYWKIIERILSSVRIKSRIDIISGSIQFWNTKLTRDPFAIFNARDFLKLISRGVPIERAAKIFDDDIYCDIIKINTFSQKKDIFLKRRRRLIGKNGSTIEPVRLFAYLLLWAVRSSFSKGRCCALC